MTQDERGQAQYDQMMAFMKENHRRPSKHRLEEHDMLKSSRGASGYTQAPVPVTNRIFKFIYPELA